ncbi:MAG: 5-(carboxyamino)imidazole ribonucleotide mutase [Candidatus Desulforudis sp.]|nr:5-(carboxyamino)imidazole ribonucleotide mutase [Desulforudis sp.]
MTVSDPLVGVLMGSDSDLPVMRQAIDVLEALGVPSEVAVLSAHRSPDRAAAYGREAAGRGLKVIIAGAGVAAHLAGVLAAHTALPVIGVPVKAGPLQGLDALLSTVQMPHGVPVAAVAVNGAKNAGILAAQIIGAGDPEVRARVERYKAGLGTEADAKNARLQALGIEKYLRERSLTDSWKDAAPND